jgi:hypothetical protein
MTELAGKEEGLSVDKDGACLLFDSLLSCRKLLKPDAIQGEIERIRNFLDSAGISATGPLVTILHTCTDASARDAAAGLDLELLFPLPGQVSLTAPYSFVPRLKIVDALCIQCSGRTNSLGILYASFLGCIRQHEAGSSAETCSVIVVNPRDPDVPDTFNLDFYIGVRAS